jgi:hypothetical protein
MPYIKKDEATRRVEYRCGEHALRIIKTRLDASSSEGRVGVGVTGAGRHKHQP